MNKPRIKTLQPRVAAAKVARVQSAPSPTSWRAGMTSAERGYGYKWQQARDGYLRLHPLCVMCRADGLVTLATVVDHIEPHRGDQRLFWDSENWQSLCATHHSGEKQRQEAEQRRQAKALG